MILVSVFGCHGGGGLYARIGKVKESSGIRLASMHGGSHIVALWRIRARCILPEEERIRNVRRSCFLHLSKVASIS